MGGRPQQKVVLEKTVCSLLNNVFISKQSFILWGSNSDMIMALVPAVAVVRCSAALPGRQHNVMFFVKCDFHTHTHTPHKVMSVDRDLGPHHYVCDDNCERHTNL